MTAIIGYTKRSKTDSVGILYTDDLVDNRNAKVDKITKVSNRFAISIAGREIASTLLYWVLGYFDQFSPSKKSLTSVEHLVQEISTFFPIAIRKLKERNVVGNIEEQIDMPSIMVVLDTDENRLYFGDIGKVWRCDESPNYTIKLIPLEDGYLYSFGSVAGSKGFIRKEFADVTIETAINAAKIGIIMQQGAMPQYVGNIGSHLINIIGGDNPLHVFASCYSSVEDLLNNVIMPSN